jgi:hypothetical protein
LIHFWRKNTELIMVDHGKSTKRKKFHDKDKYYNCKCFGFQSQAACVLYLRFSYLSAHKIQWPKNRV